MFAKGDTVCVRQSIWWYTEIDRIYGTVRAYKTCMMANGWSTEKCIRSDKPDKDCVEVFYPIDPVEGI